MLQTINVNRCTTEFPLFAESILPRYSRHFQALRIVLDGRVDRKSVNQDIVNLSPNRILAVDIERCKIGTDWAVDYTNTVMNSMLFFSLKLGLFIPRVTHLHIAWLTPHVTAQIASFFPGVRHLMLQGGCLWTVEDDDRPMKKLLGIVSKMDLEFLELDRSDGNGRGSFNGRGGGHFHPAWRLQEWTSSPNLKSLVIRAPAFEANEWHVLARFAPNLSTLRLELTKPLPYTVYAFPSTPFPSLRNLTLIGGPEEVQAVLDTLSSSPLKHLSITFTSAASIEAPGLVPWIRARKPRLLSLDCTEGNTEALPPMRFLRVLDIGGESLSKVCEEGKTRYTSDGRMV